MVDRSLQRDIADQQESDASQSSYHTPLSEQSTGQTNTTLASSMVDWTSWDIGQSKATIELCKAGLMSAEAASEALRAQTWSRSQADIWPTNHEAILAALRKENADVVADLASLRDDQAQLVQVLQNERSKHLQEVGDLEEQVIALNRTAVSLEADKKALEDKSETLEGKMETLEAVNKAFEGSFKAVEAESQELKEQI